MIERRKYLKKPIRKDRTCGDPPYRAVNFPINKNGDPICPNGTEFKFPCKYF